MFSFSFQKKPIDWKACGKLFYLLDKCVIKWHDSHLHGNNEPHTSLHLLPHNVAWMSIICSFEDWAWIEHGSWCRTLLLGKQHDNACSSLFASLWNHLLILSKKLSWHELFAIVIHIACSMKDACSRSLALTVELSAPDMPAMINNTSCASPVWLKHFFLFIFSLTCYACHQTSIPSTPLNNMELYIPAYNHDLHKFQSPAMRQLQEWVRPCSVSHWGTHPSLMRPFP